MINTQVVPKSGLHNPIFTGNSSLFFDFKTTDVSPQTFYTPISQNLFILSPQFTKKGCYHSKKEDPSQTIAGHCPPTRTTYSLKEVELAAKITLFAKTLIRKAETM
jgi:hypothetical protein